MNNSPQTILVTGGAGFIGSSLCDMLLSQGTQVVCLDNFDPFYSEETKFRNLAKALKNPRFHLIRGDVRCKPDLEKVFLKFKPDVVVHLAAKAGVRKSLSQPAEYLDVNVKGTLLLLEAMNACGVKKLVFASSSSVYGETNTASIEKDSTDRPCSPYASSKVAGELLAYNFVHNHQFQVLILRFFSVYGPRQRPDLAIHKFFKGLFFSSGVSVFGNGDQTRDFTHISDVLLAINSSIQLVFKASSDLFETINIGSGRPISVNRTIELIQQLVGHSVDVKTLERKRSDVSANHADISKAKGLLGYTPKTSIKDGLSDFFDWFQKMQDNQKSA